MHITDRIQISVLKNISICFGAQYYGYPDFSVRIETNRSKIY